MKTIVLKFGGTSVGTIDRIKKVCKIIAFYKKKKNKVVVVSSAMSGVTNELVNKSKLVSSNFDRAEYDVLVSTGEQVDVAAVSVSAQKPSLTISLMSLSTGIVMFLVRYSVSSATHLSTVQQVNLQKEYH